MTAMRIVQDRLVLETRDGPVTIRNEPTYSFGSADNRRTYDTEIRLGEAHLPSVHGVRAEGKWSAVVGAGGGRSGVHQHSAVELDGRLYLAVGDQMVCLTVATGAMGWSRRVDPATCFGVYWDPSHEALLSHGELQVARFSLAGDELWSAGGADIFTEGFRCLADGIEVIDFNRSVYLFDYRTGALLDRR